MGACVGLRGPESRGVERGNNLKKERGGKGFFSPFFLFCDFYQSTEIQHTHRHKSAVLYLQLRLAPAPLAGRLQGGVVGEGVSHISRERG